MTGPRKILAQAGFEPRIFRSRGGRLNHQDTEAVSVTDSRDHEGSYIVTDTCSIVRG